MSKVLQVFNKDERLKIDQIPIECPYCHNYQLPSMYGAYLYAYGEYFISCSCTNTKCKTAFMIFYNSHEAEFRRIKQTTLKAKSFNNIILELSPTFCEIYNQSYSAEQLGLDQISGVGYRKALEFLIKDYLISLNPENEETIKKKSLGNCIDQDIKYENIKNVAKRATWIGNDETHYIRKWEDKDVSHLKSLIELSAHWIESEIQTKRILEEMPEGK